MGCLDVVGRWGNVGEEGVDGVRVDDVDGVGGKIEGDGRAVRGEVVGRRVDVGVGRGGGGGVGVGEVVGELGVGGG